MPHITIEYTAELDGRFDVQDLVNAVHDAAIATAVFPLGGIRTLAAMAQASRVADGGPAAHMQIRMRIAPGRSAEAKRMVAEQLFAAAEAQLANAFADMPMGLQFELSEFDPALTLSRNTMIPAPGIQDRG